MYLSASANKNSLKENIRMMANNLKTLTLPYVLQTKNHISLTTII